MIRNETKLQSKPHSLTRTSTGFFVAGLVVVIAGTIGCKTVTVQLPDDAATVVIDGKTFEDVQSPEALDERGDKPGEFTYDVGPGFDDIPVSVSAGETTSTGLIPRNEMSWALTTCGVCGAAYQLPLFVVLGAALGNVATSGGIFRLEPGAVVNILQNPGWCTLPCIFISTGCALSPLIFLALRYPADDFYSLLSADEPAVAPTSPAEHSGEVSADVLDSVADEGVDEILADEAISELGADDSDGESDADALNLNSAKNEGMSY